MEVRKDIQVITDRIIERSKISRNSYLERMAKAREAGVIRKGLSCGNLAHAFAGCDPSVKTGLKGDVPNIGIISAYNDMLSAHKNYENYPEQIRASAQKYGAVAQFAGGVPAMCDGVTQGQTGMELSLFSRDVIALSASVALSHNMFDGVLCLGICDKIVPGLMIASLSFGHLPIVFVPGGPMKSGIPNEEKARVRQEFAAGKIGEKELLETEAASYHSAGTCTFYGTANSNQMLMEIMGVHLPGSSFVNPDTELRTSLTDYAVKQVLEIRNGLDSYTPICNIVDEKAFVNAIVGLNSTGGSTNLTIHLIAMAKAAGIIINWEDFAAISEVVPLITRVYPNGSADINHFHTAGGMRYLMSELSDNGMLHQDVTTVMGQGLSAYFEEPVLKNGQLTWEKQEVVSHDNKILASVKDPFQQNGGLKLIVGDLGRGVIKISAVAEDKRVLEAPAVVFEDQNEIIEAFKRGELNRDFIAVLRYQGPKANGMPELHKLTPTLSILQQNGFKVALVTDGRMSGASGKVPAVIHLTPEALEGGLIAKVINGDIISIDANKGTMSIANPDEVSERVFTAPDLSKNETGLGRELFTIMRQSVGSSEIGASIF